MKRRRVVPPNRCEDCGRRCWSYLCDRCLRSQPPAPVSIRELRQRMPPLVRKTVEGVPPELVDRAARYCVECWCELGADVEADAERCPECRHRDATPEEIRGELELVLEAIVDGELGATPATVELARVELAARRRDVARRAS